MPRFIQTEAGTMAGGLDLDLSDEEAGVMVYATKDDEGKTIEVLPVSDSGESARPLLSRIIAAHHDPESGEISYPSPLPAATRYVPDSPSRPCSKRGDTLAWRC
jgi:hypothetical protein